MIYKSAKELEVVLDKTNPEKLGEDPDFININLNQFELRDRVIKNVYFKDIFLTQVQFFRCVFENCKFESFTNGDDLGQFAYCEFNNCEMDHLRAKFLNCKFYSCEMSGLPSIHISTFEKCRVMFSEFYSCSLKLSEISNSDIRACQVELCDLNNSQRMQDSKLKQSTLNQSEFLSVSKCELHNCSYVISPAVVEFVECSVPSEGDIDRLYKFNENFIQYSNKLAREEYQKDLDMFFNQRDPLGGVTYRTEPREPREEVTKVTHLVSLIETPETNSEESFEDFILNTLEKDYSIKNLRIENGIIIRGETRLGIPSRLAIEEGEALEKIAGILCL